MKNFSVQYLLSHIDNKKDLTSAVPQLPPPPLPLPTSPSTPITLPNSLTANSSDDVGKNI